LGRRFMHGKVNGPERCDLPAPSSDRADGLLLFDVTGEEKWRDNVREWADRLNDGGTLFLYEKHKKYGGFDAVLLVKFLIESVGLEVLEYSTTEDLYGGYYVAARKHRQRQVMVRVA